MWFLKTMLSVALLPLFSVAGYGGYSEGIIHGSLRDANVFQHCRYNDTSECPLSSLTEPTLIYPGGQTRCAFDTSVADKTSATYRFQVHPGTGEASRNLVLFFQGGGVCLSPESCNYIFNAQIQEKSGQPLFQYMAIPERDGFIRDDEVRNPFRGWTKVIVIYCTGDVHLGNTRIEDRAKDIHLNGALNTQSVLRWVYTNIRDPAQVFLAGSSAGAIGAQLWSRDVFRQYAHVSQLTFLSDSFPGFSTPVQGTYMPFFHACELFTSVYRSACLNESLVMSDFSLSVTREFPHVPFLYLYSKSDEIQRMFYCVGIYRHEIWIALAKLRSCISPERYYDGVQAVMSNVMRLSPENNVLNYVVDGTDHVIFPMSRLYTTYVGDVALSDWIGAFTFPNRSTSVISSVCAHDNTSVMTECNAKSLASKYYGHDVRDTFVMPIMDDEITKDEITKDKNSASWSVTSFSVSSILTSSVLVWCLML